MNNSFELPKTPQSCTSEKSNSAIFLPPSPLIRGPHSAGSAPKTHFSMQSPNHNKPNSSSAFSVSEHSFSASGVNGDLNRLEGETYEIAVINIFTGNHCWNQPFALMKKNLEMYINIPNNKMDTKDIDLIFASKEEMDLNKLKDLLTGQKIHLCGSLNQSLKIITKDPSVRDPSFNIPSDSLVFLEIKKSGSQLSKALTQQDNNLHYFLEWIKGNMERSLFSETPANVKLEEKLTTFILSKQKFNLYLLICTNGDFTNIPDNQKMKLIFQGKKTRKKVSHLSFWIKTSGGKFKHTYVAQGKPVIGIEIHIHVLFLYIPNYMSTTFLKNQQQQVLEKQNEELKEAVKKVEKDNEEIKKINEEFLKSSVKANQKVQELQESRTKVDQKVQGLTNQVNLLTKLLLKLNPDMAQELQEMEESQNAQEQSGS